MRQTMIMALSALALAPAGCGKSADKPATASSSEPGTATLTTAIGSAAGMTTIATAIKSTGLATVFDGSAPYTVLVPRDEAFAALGDAGTRLAAPENGAAMAAVIKAHVLPGFLTVADIDAALKAAHGKPVRMTTMADSVVSFSRDGKALTVTAADGSSAQVSGSAVIAGNGVAIPISKVLKKIPATSAG